MARNRLKPDRRAAWIPLLLLTSVTAVWGWTFVVVRDAIATFPVSTFLAFRFGLAMLCLLPVLAGGGIGLRDGLWPGLALAAGYGCQTAGLQYTTASKAGLLTGLFVVFTPALEVALYRRRPSWYTVVAVPIALIGTALLTSGGNQSPHGDNTLLGDSLEVATALCFSIHMILLGRISPSVSARHVALAQMSVAAILFTGVTLASHPAFHVTGQVAWAVLVTGTLASAAAFYIQTYVQQRVSPSRTAMILVTEPAFALLFGVLLAGDSFSAIHAIGAGIILAVLVLHESLATRSSLSAGQAVST